MDRPSLDQIYLRLARDLSRRSTCLRLRVGTVVTSEDGRKVLSIGYNGNGSGLPNRCDRDDAGNCGCLHSEENAIINCDSPREVRKVVYITHSPCVMCAKRLINLGNVVRVVYAEEYRVKTGVELLWTRTDMSVDHVPIEEEGFNHRCPHYWADHHRQCLLPIGHVGEHEFQTPESRIIIEGI